MEILRDTTRERWRELLAIAGGENFVLSRFTQLEILLGCRNEQEWTISKDYFDEQIYLDITATSWEAAARIHFDLRRLGRTIVSPIDCCIAQLAIQNDVLLLHRDRDFETIARIRPLRQQWVRW